VIVDDKHVTVKTGFVDQTDPAASPFSEGVPGTLDATCP
jgi:hypothetical protein